MAPVGQAVQGNEVLDPQHRHVGAAQWRGLAAELGDAGLLAVFGDDGHVGEQHLRVGPFAVRPERGEVMGLEAVVVVQEEHPFAARQGEALVAALGRAVAAGALDEGVSRPQVAGDDRGGVGVQRVGDQQDLEVGAGLRPQRRDRPRQRRRAVRGCGFHCRHHPHDRRRPGARGDRLGAGADRAGGHALHRRGRPRLPAGLRGRHGGAGPVALPCRHAAGQRGRRWILRPPGVRRVLAPREHRADRLSRPGQPLPPRAPRAAVRRAAAGRLGLGLCAAPRGRAHGRAADGRRVAKRRPLGLGQAVSAGGHQLLFAQDRRGPPRGELFPRRLGAGPRVLRGAVAALPELRLLGRVHGGLPHP
ncbi:hypothetical protein OSTOST_05727 [Ostertagia ostertagi]